MTEKTIPELLARIVRERDAALSAASTLERRERALNTLEVAMFTIHKLLGPDLLAATVLDVDSADRGAILHEAARRLFALCAVFGEMPPDPAAPIRIVEEALAVSRGDAPLLFARLDQQKVNHRINRAKFDALRWDAYLDGKGLKPGERHATIAEAYGTSWETIRRSWRRDVLGRNPDPTDQYLLNRARADGVAGMGQWGGLGDTEWRRALFADGDRYRAILRENNGNV